MKADEARTRGYKMPVAQPAAEPTTPHQAQSLPRVESAPFVIEGVIAETHYDYGRVNPLEGILKGPKEQGLVTGIAGVLGCGQRLCGQPLHANPAMGAAAPEESNRTAAKKRTNTRSKSHCNWRSHALLAT